MDKTIELKSSRAIKIGAIISYLALAIDVVAGIAYTPWIISQIGKSRYGLYSLALTLINMFMLDFGMSAAVSKFVSNYRAKKDYEGINNFLGMIYKLYIVVSVVISLVLIIVFLYINQIYVKLTPSELEAFKIVYIIAAVSTVTCFPFLTLNGILNAYEEFAPMKLADMFNRVITIVMTIVALLFGMGLYALVFINSFFNIITMILKLIIVKKRTNVKVNFKYYDKRMLQNIAGFSLWTTVVSIAQRFIFNIVPTILGIVSGSVSITMFSLANSLESYVYRFSQAINGMFMSKISRATVGSKSGENVLPLMIKVGRIVLSVLAIVVIGIITLGKKFVVLWVGKDFSTVYICTVLLVLPAAFHRPQQVANTAVIVLDKVKTEGIVSVIMAVINIVLSFIFGYFWGEIGCSISICIAYFVRTVLMNIVFYKDLKIDVFKFFRECHLKMAPGILITLAAGFIISKYVNVFSGWIAFGVQVILLTLVYIIVMWIIGWNKYEKDLFTSVFKKIINLKGRQKNV